VMVAGGVNSSGVLDSVETYDYLARAWTLRANHLNIARYGHAATLLQDGRVLVTGGDNGTGEIGAWEMYSPGTDAWDRSPSAQQEMLVPRLRHNATLLPNGKVMLTGGMTKFGEPVEWTEEFDVQFSSWSMMGTMQVPRGYHTTVLLHDGTLAAIGGFTGLNRLTSVETRYFGLPIDELTPEGTQRQPQNVDVDTGTLAHGGFLTLRGERFKGVSEASGGRGNANSSFNGPRLYFQRMDGSGNNSQASSGFSVDLSTSVYRYLKDNPNTSSWSAADSSITFQVPASTALLPAGWYQVRVAANAQFSTAKAVQVGPPRPSGQPGIPIGTRLGLSSVSWTWAAAPGTFDGYHIYSDTNGVFVGTSASNSFIQKNLGPNSVASVRVAPYNISGDGLVGVSTIALANQSAVVDGLRPANRTSVSITWSWSPNPIAVAYNIFSTTAPAPIARPSANTFVLTGLSTNSAYAMAVQAVTDTSLGPLTATVTAYTLAASPSPGAPSLIPSTGSILAQWFTVGNPSATFYSVQAAREDGSTTTFDDVAGNEYGITGDFIRPNTQYRVYLSAVNGDGIHTPDSPLFLGATCSFAMPPANATITDAGPSSIGISWSANGNPSSTTYMVTYQADTSSGDCVTQTTTVAWRTSALSASISDLLTSRDYTICISAFNRYGQQTAFVAASAFTSNGGGPPGSLIVSVPRARATTFMGNVGTVTIRTVEMSIPAETFDNDMTLYVTSYVPSGISMAPGTCGGLDDSVISVTPSLDAQPRRPFELGISYEDRDHIADPSTLSVIRYDPASGTCVPMKTTRIDAQRKVVIAEVNHLSIFKLMQISPAAAVEDMRVFPNPLFTHSQGFFTFDRMPAGTHVRIYTLHGEGVFDDSANASGILTWDAHNKSGRPVGSGVYLAVVENGGTKKIVKVVVIR